MTALNQVRDPDRRRVRFGALDLQHEPIKQELRAAFDRVLASSACTQGAEVEGFEAEFARYCGVQHCVGVSSGTAALTLLLRAYNIGPGDEVIVPAHTFIASALAVAYVGATPVLCDVADDTGLIDPVCARAVTGPRTAAIIAVHLYGQVCNMNALAELANPRGIILLEDAAQAAGSQYRGRRAGALGAAAGFSFYPGKKPRGSRRRRGHLHRRRSAGDTSACCGTSASGQKGSTWSWATTSGWTGCRPPSCG